MNLNYRWFFSLKIVTQSPWKWVLSAFVGIIFFILSSINFIYAKIWFLAPYKEIRTALAHCINLWNLEWSWTSSNRISLPLQFILPITSSSVERSLSGLPHPISFHLSTINYETIYETIFTHTVVWSEYQHCLGPVLLSEI